MDSQVQRLLGGLFQPRRDVMELAIVSDMDILQRHLAPKRRCLDLKQVAGKNTSLNLDHLLRATNHLKIA